MAAPIISQDGSVWAQSTTFPQLKIEEVTGVEDFAGPGSLAPTGLYLGSTKYMVIQGLWGCYHQENKSSFGH
ncbi:hypothetical protein MRB53_017194 [Persea americana]|uniref:Uncharacterized protein n=1 Tax=Persea americana TaxID=3435 RepID=A0ACC2M4G4_PERAE|nr:hypothetical protein MRB53_017194 [Persea americana]